jgi:hypothetical protein
MIIERFNDENRDVEYTDEIINIINKIKQKIVSDEVYYTLYSITLFKLGGELYQEFKIKPDSLVRTTTLEKCVNYYELYKNQYDVLFIVKELTKNELVPDDDIQLVIKTNKYNL